VWSDNVKRVVTTFGPQPWQDKIDYMTGKGARFEHVCKPAGCYFESTYTGAYATISLYLTDGRAGRAGKQTWCVSDPNASVRSCYDQTGPSSWVMRYDGSNWNRF
jgi:hypothetical protein